MIKFKKIILILLFFTSINAIIAGVLFIIDSSGGLIGLNLEYLQNSPFKNYLIPGIILLIVNGIFNLVTAIFVIKNYKYSRKFVFIQGIFLLFWIIIQIFMVRDINALHIIMFLIGLVLVILSKFAKNQL